MLLQQPLSLNLLGLKKGKSHLGMSAGNDNRRPSDCPLDCFPWSSRNPPLTRVQGHEMHQSHFREMLLWKLVEEIHFAAAAAAPDRRRRFTSSAAAGGLTTRSDPVRNSKSLSLGARELSYLHFRALWREKMAKFFDRRWQKTSSRHDDDPLSSPRRVESKRVFLLL